MKLYTKTVGQGSIRLSSRFALFEAPSLNEINSLYRWNRPQSNINVNVDDQGTMVMALALACATDLPIKPLMGLIEANSLYYLIIYLDGQSSKVSSER